MLVTLADLPKIRKENQGKKIVLGGGAFDILHQGHVVYLHNLKKLGDVLVIAVKSDVEIRSYKGEDRPIQNEDVRAALVDALRDVDYTVVSPDGKEGEGEPPRLTVARALKPDILATWNDKWLAHKDELKAFGVELMVVPIEKMNSTTSIIEHIRNLKA